MQIIVLNVYVLTIYNLTWVEVGDVNLDEKRKQPVILMVINIME